MVSVSGNFESGTPLFASEAEPDFDLAEPVDDVPDYESQSQETEIEAGDVSPDESEPAEVIRAARPKRSHRKKVPAAV